VAAYSVFIKTILTYHERDEIVSCNAVSNSSKKYQNRKFEILKLSANEGGSSRDHGGHKIRIKNDPRDQYDIFLAWDRFWTGPKWPGSEPLSQKIPTKIKVSMAWLLFGRLGPIKPDFY